MKGPFTHTLRCAMRVKTYFVSTSALVLARYSQSARGIPYINIHSLLVMTFTVILALHIVSSALQVFLKKNDMRCINPRFTYLLTYLFIYFMVFSRI